MSQYKVVGYDKITDGNSKIFIVYLNSIKGITYNGTTYFKKSSIVVESLPSNVYGATVEVDWKSNTIKKVEVK